MYDRNQLRRLICEQGLKFGDFTLASGKKAKYYLDCRKVTLDAAGAKLIGAGILNLLGDNLPDAIGGMAIGADPITGAVITLAGTQDRMLKGFIVRKEAKSHGTGQMVEGPVQPGQSAIIVEDVVTTGASSLKAIEHVQAFGMKVVGVIAIVDRLEGGCEAFAEKGFELQTLFTIRDFMNGDGIEQ